jgi:Uncharacterized protein conserved in bacteria
MCGLMLALVLGLGVVAVHAAENLDAVKARMKQRLSQVDQLKASGAIGENNRGFLEVRGGGGDAASVVSAENRDREAVYAEIAKRAGSTSEQVGRARARRIAAASEAGVWLQREDGNWYKK